MRHRCEQGQGVSLHFLSPGPYNRIDVGIRRTLRTSRDDPPDIALHLVRRKPLDHAHHLVLPKFTHHRLVQWTNLDLTSRAINDRFDLTAKTEVEIRWVRYEVDTTFPDRPL
ncbi:hypothetical protein D9M69_670940 [compost metagenome]